LSLDKKGVSRNKVLADSGKAKPENSSIMPISLVTGLKLGVAVKKSSHGEHQRAMS
jgi:hypothetical protein